MSKVLVWTQAYNAEHTIRRAMDSMLGQSYRDIEYYVLDNGSTDGTGDIIREYAARDSRVKPIYFLENSLVWTSYLVDILLNTSACQWFCWLDADDEYCLDFLQEAVHLAEKENLDIVAGGYDRVCGVSGKLLKHRVAEKTFILEKNGFADRFIDYRGFTTTLWGKIFSIDVMCGIVNDEKLQKKVKNKKVHAFSHNKWVLYGESFWLLSRFILARRIGVLNKVVYYWYDYPRSLSKTLGTTVVIGYEYFWLCTKRYIDSFGKISKKNLDFLYAIYLSMMQEHWSIVRSADIDIDLKLRHIVAMFSSEIAKETFAHRAGEQIRGLAARGAFVQEVREWISAQLAGDCDKDVVKKALRVLSIQLTRFFRIAQCKYAHKRRVRCIMRLKAMNWRLMG
jgi:glycosyltransferase involved in cell wall biosynthesis